MPNAYLILPSGHPTAICLKPFLTVRGDVSILKGKLLVSDASYVHFQVQHSEGEAEVLIPHSAVLVILQDVRGSIVGFGIEEPNQPRLQ